MENPVEGHSYMRVRMRMYTVRYSTGRRNCNRNILNDHEFAEDFTAQADTTTFTLPQTKFAAAGSTCISHTQQSTCLHPHLRTQTDPLPETSCSPAFLNTGLSTRSQNPVILSKVVDTAKMKGDARKWKLSINGTMLEIFVETLSKNNKKIPSGYSNLRSRVLSMSADRSATMIGLICCSVTSQIQNNVN